MKCPKCNKIYEDGTVFCGECGSYIGEVKDDNMDKTMAIPVIKDYERVYNAPKSTPQKQSAKAPAQRESTPRTNTPPVRKVREQKENPVETSSKQKNILVFVIAFLVVVIIALATILGFMAIDSMKENNVDNGESVSSAVNAPKEEKKNTKDDKAKEEEETEEEEKEEATMEGEPGKIDRDADFDFAYGLNPGNADRSYTTLTNGDLSYKCALPSDFKFKSDSGDRLRYVAKDKTAYIDIGGVKNGNKLSTQAVMANAKSDIGGATVYESSGDDWFAVNMEKDGICYYQMCYVDEYIRYFEMVFPKEYADVYETYVEEISDSFVRTE